MQKELIAFLKKIKKALPGYNRDKLPYIFLTIIALVVFVGSLNLFIELTEGLKSEALATYDASLTDSVTSARSPFLTTYFKFVTDVGDAMGYLIVFVVCTLLFYLMFKNWEYVVQISVVMILALSSNLLLKEIINRARPSAEHLVTVKTLSYPSGHAMMAMAFYGFLIYLISNFKISRLLKYTIITLLVVLILSIGVSRIYLGVHYPSDIAGGYIAGFIWVVFCVMAFNLIKIFRRDPAT